MEFITQLIVNTTLQVWTTFLHNWPFLIVSVVIAVCLKLFLNADKVSAFLARYRKAGIIGATAAAVATPLCSCGTTAVILGMMASTIPWAPIIAFMVASPLTSPEELIYSAGLFGWPFALAFFISSIILGLAGGLIGEFLERRGWLANQARLAAPSAARQNSTPTTASESICACESTPAAVFTARPMKINRPLANQAAVLFATSIPVGEAAFGLPTCCAAPIPSKPAACECEQSYFSAESGLANRSTADPVDITCSCETSQTEPGRSAVSWRQFLEETLSTGKRLLVMFLGFAFIGYLLNGLIPSAWVAAVFGPGKIYSVPLAATLGLPLYINTEASLPLVRALIEGGMSQGAAMAFLISGAGTSIGAFAGALTIARWRVIATVIGTLWVGAMVMGFLYDVLLSTGLF